MISISRCVRDLVWRSICLAACSILCPVEMKNAAMANNNCMEVYGGPTVRHILINFKNADDERYVPGYHLGINGHLETNFLLPEDTASPFALVDFTISPVGSISEPTLIHRSGNDLFDRLAMKSVLDAGRLQEAPYGSIAKNTIHCRFKFKSSYQISVCSSDDINVQFYKRYSYYFDRFYKEIKAHWDDDTASLREAERAISLKDCKTFAIGDLSVPLTKGVGAMKVKLYKTGEVADLKMLRPSSDPQLDQAALAAVKKSAPFKPLSSDSPPSMDFNIVFGSDLSSVRLQPSWTMSQKLLRAERLSGQTQRTKSNAPPYETFKVFLPQYRMQGLNQLLISRYLNATYVANMPLSEILRNQDHLRFSYQRAIGNIRAAALLAQAVIQDGFAPGSGGAVVQAQDLPALQISESRVTPYFHPPEFCGRSVENRVRIFGKGKLIATTPKGRQIWETELDSFDAKSAHFGVKVIVVNVEDTLFEFDLLNAVHKPSSEEWVRLVDSLKEVNPDEVKNGISK